MLRDIRSIMVLQDQSILKVMKAINESTAKFAMVVNDEEHLVGIVTDGDIRRGFINGHGSDEPIKNIMNSSPVVAKENLTQEAMLDLVNDKFALVPVIGDDGRIKGIITYKDKNILIDTKARGICTVGLGFVGLTLSVVLADLGFNVYGYDINQKVLTDLEERKSTFHEKGLDAYLHRHVGENLKLVSDISKSKADTYIITVGTPILPESKLPNIGYIENAAASVATVLKRGDLVVLRSTVPVGTTRSVVAPIIKKISGLVPGQDYYLAYAPERTIEGNAIPELRELPQIIGGYDKKSTIMVDQLFREVTSTIVDTGTLEGAEMAKILNNTFRDVKFAFANELALICKELGLDMVKLVHAANLGYVRDKIPVPSPGVGGACLTKDSYLLKYSCRELKNKPGIVELSRKSNELVPSVIADEICHELEKLNKVSPKIFIVGFAFKGEPETSDVRDSATLDLLRYLRQRVKGSPVFEGYDPIVTDEVVKGFAVKPVSLDNGFRDADVVVFMNNHKSYWHIDIFELLNTSKRNCVFIDGWHIYEPNDIKSINNVKYIGVGCK